MEDNCVGPHYHQVTNYVTVTKSVTLADLASLTVLSSPMSHNDWIVILVLTRDAAIRGPHATLGNCDATRYR